jgi:hypothetical protein
MDVGLSSNTRSLCWVSLASNIGLQLYGKNWKKIEELVVSRTGSQIRSHAQKYFIKSKKEYMEPTTEDTANPIPAEVLTMAPAVVSGCSEHSYFMAAMYTLGSSECGHPCSRISISGSSSLI